MFYSGARVGIKGFAKPPCTHKAATMRNALRAGWLLAAAILRKRKLGPLYSRKFVGGCWGTSKKSTGPQVKDARLMGGTCRTGTVTGKSWADLGAEGRPSIWPEHPSQNSGDSCCLILS